MRNCSSCKLPDTDNARMKIFLTTRRRVPRLSGGRGTSLAALNTSSSHGMMVRIEANRFEQPEPATSNVLNWIGKTILYHLLAQPAQQPRESGQRPAEMISPDF